jgi:hypothetical protein
VEVLNGSGIAGAAGRAATALRADGFTVTSIGTASSYGFVTSVIDYGPGGLAAAQSLAASVGGGAALQESSSLGSSTVILTVGQSFTGIGAAGASTSSSSATTSTTTPAPTTTSTTYVLPGTPANFTPPC